MTNQELATQILSGLPRDEVKELFASGPGKNVHAGARGRLTIELESILDMLPDVITGDQAEALISLAMEETRPCDLYDWLSGRLAPTWKEAAHNLREAERRRLAQGFFHGLTSKSAAPIPNANGFSQRATRSPNRKPSSALRARNPRSGSGLIVPHGLGKNYAAGPAGSPSVTTAISRSHSTWC